MDVCRLGNMEEPSRNGIYNPVCSAGQGSLLPSSNLQQCALESPEPLAKAQMAGSPSWLSGRSTSKCVSNKVRVILTLLV